MCCASVSVPTLGSHVPDAAAAPAPIPGSRVFIPVPSTPVFVLSMFSASWPRGTFFLATWLLFGFFLFISMAGNVFQPNFSSLGANFCSRLFTWERRKKRCGGGLCRMNRGFFLKALLPSIHRTSQIMSSATEHDPVLCDDCSFRAHRVSTRTVASQHLLHHIQNFLH